MQSDETPLGVNLSDRLGPVGWRYVPSEVWGEQVLTQDPKTAQLARDMGRDVEPLYTEAQMMARVAAERERWNAAASAALEVLDDFPTWANAGFAATELRKLLKY